MPRKSAPPPATPALDAAVALVVAQVQRELGRESLVRLNGPGAYPEIKHVVATGLPSLDYIFGCGGLPLGKLIELFGPEAVGKSTLTKILAAACQRVGIMPILIDTEQSGMLEFDTGLGLDPTLAAGGQPETLEEVFALIVAVVEALEAIGVLGMVFFDSVAATPLLAELEAEFDAVAAPAVRARFLSQHLKQLVNKLRSGRVGLFFVNQVREIIGATQYQKKTFSPGGRALRHHAHVRLEMSHAGPIRVGDTQVGIKFRIKCIKSKIAMPYREALMEIRLHPLPPRVVDPLGVPTPMPARTPMPRPA